MGTLGLWIFGSFLVGFIGVGRKGGYLGALVLSLLLSPVIGAIIALLLPENGKKEREREMLDLQRQQAEALASIQKQAAPNATGAPSAAALSLPADPDARAARLKDLRDRGIITQEEFLSLIG